jgi:hypothetical protein
MIKLPYNKMDDSKESNLNGMDKPEAEEIKYYNG